MCVCVCVCVCVCARVCVRVCACVRAFGGGAAPDSVETVCEQPLLLNNTESETFLHKLGAVRSVYWIFINESPAWR